MSHRQVKFPKINPCNLKGTIASTLQVYNRLVIPEDFAELHDQFKKHWDDLYQLIESTSLESRVWRQKNEDLIQRIIVKQQFLALQFEDKEKELLGENTVNNPPVSSRNIDAILLQSHLAAMMPSVDLTGQSNNKNDSIAESPC